MRSDAQRAQRLVVEVGYEVHITCQIQQVFPRATLDKVGKRPVDHFAFRARAGQFHGPVNQFMSYGQRTSWSWRGMTADDRAGVSLLRPDPRWRRGAGGISGRLHVNGQPVNMAHVWAFPNGDGAGRDGVGAFSDPQGEFLIEGLAPGDYTLWVSPLTEQHAHPGIGNRVAPEAFFTDLDDTVWPYPVRVEPGRVAGGVEIALARGRECREPSPCTPPEP